MDEDEAALLAELRAISAGSAASRFQDEEENNAGPSDNDNDKEIEEKEQLSSEPPAETKEKEEEPVYTNAPPPVAQSLSQSSSKTAPQSNQKQRPLPPWKKKAAQPKAAQDVDVVIAAPPAPATSLDDQPIGLKTQSTFQGERGGAAEDEDLLAELRAISGKSSAANRFADEENNNEHAVNGNEQPPEVAAPRKNNGPPKPEDIPPPKTIEKPPAPSSSNNMEKTKPDRHGMDILVSSRSEDQDIVSVLSEPSVFASGGFQKPSTPSQFKGERGGPAEDTELLAELQAISEKSKSSDRFAEENNEQNDNNEADEKPAQSTPPATTQPKRKTDELPPWKRKNSNAKPKSQPSDDDNIVVAAPPRPAPAPTPVPESGGFKKSDLPQTFQGDRGGTAEDEELLAELRAISSKSSSADRFAEDDDADAMELQTEPVMENPVPPKPKTKKPVAPSEEAELPPWKRKPQNAKPKDNDDFEVVVSAPPPPSKPATKESPMPDVGGFQKSNLPSTFTGERGGVAEDEALLAELRAVSSRSTGANRFEEDGNTGNEATADSSTPEPRETSAPLKPAPAAVNGKKDATLPPWKRKTQNAKPKEDFEVTISAPPALVKETVKEDPIPTTDSFQKESNLPNTFKGERGGAAEDEALLAELMAISSKSSGANRFAEEDAAAQPAPAPVQEEKQAALPPWKRKGQQSSKPTPSRDVDVVVSAPPAPAPAAVKKDPEPTMGGFQKESNLPNSFKGERGGAAEDEALLAELRAISSGAGGASRFQDNDNSEDAQAPPPAAPPKRQQPSLAPKPKSFQPNAAGGAPVGGPRVIETHQAAPSADAPEGNVTIDDFPGALSDKSWKTRKEAYGFLQTTLGNLVSGKEPANDIDAGSIVDGLDSLVPGMLGDNNAGALDAALQFAVAYADYSRGATASEQAGSMVGALVKGSALSSSRPSTTKLSSELVLKLVEVGENGTASAHAVVEVLLNKGLASRKPKVVMSSISLIHDAAIAFGAACLPIALITSSAPKFLSHSNAKVRDNGLKIIAEIARTLGSTSHIQGILDGMKKAQVDQLNAMIKEQSKPSPIGVGFRHESSDGPSSAEDALAALESGNAELEAKRFATRPAVNLIEEVAKSEYSTRITHKKWSEKVAALDKVLECGGEKPYKLAEPSPSVKYGPLISEMKKLLGHTHFAVASKAMEVLSMLAEGAGEKLFPYLRPLVGTLFSLSKDKKLNKPVASCLDSFFGRIVSFEHLLEADALPEALDERKEKNALARSSTLDFLGRCVMRRDDAGPRGVLTADIAQNVAEMAVSKLEDSDAGVRKAALGVLQNLQLLEDETVAEVVSSVIEGIQKTNARAYKTLSRTMRPVSNKAADSSATKETTEGPKRAMGASQRKVVTNEPTATQELSTAPSQLLEKKSSRSTNRDSEPPKAAASAPVVEGASGDVPSLDEALEAASNLGIPNFDAPEEEGGVLEGLKCMSVLFGLFFIFLVGLFV